jgi:cell division protein FtsZ
LITCPGLINVDFADVKTVMAEMGMAMMGSGTSSGEDRAREAAEAAISSPLLEDINLAGANGILANVTAGMDLSIGEFQEVGNTIKEFASDDATVVIGTVIDPEMTDKIRVTVVATGLGHSAANAESPMRIVRRPAAATASEPNYHGLDKPTVQRQRAVGDGLEDAGLQEELLDIPAFLRRQAD